MSIEGKIIVFTGRISKPRHEFQRMVEEHGGIAGSDVSGNTSYLVVGEKPGSKLFRATSLGIPTISEADFLELLKDEPAPKKEEFIDYCGTGTLRHHWFRREEKTNGDIVENCLCGTVKITHPDGRWEKHEPKCVIEQAKRISHQHAVEEERLCYQEQEESRKEEERVIEFIESLSPEEREQVRRQYAKEL